jgi:YcxB-like protein
MKESIKIDIQITKEDLTIGRGVVARDYHQPRVVFWTVQIMYVVLTLGLLVSLIYLDSIALVVVTTVWIVLVINAELIKRQANTVWELNKSFHSPMTLTLSPKGFVDEDVWETRERKWEGITKIIETPEYFFIVSPQAIFWTIPKRVLKGDEDILEVRDFLKSVLGDNFQQNS